MGIEDLSIVLKPNISRGMHSMFNTIAVDHIESEITNIYDAIEIDPIGFELYHPICPLDRILRYNGPEGIFQVHVNAVCNTGLVRALEIRVAYCNPNSVVVPMSNFVQWAMNRYDLELNILRDGPAGGLPSTLNSENADKLITEVFNYQKSFWLLDFPLADNAVLRPEEAIERFVLPECIDPNNN